MKNLSKHSKELAMSYSSFNRKIDDVLIEKGPGPDLIYSEKKLNWRGVLERRLKSWKIESNFKWNHSYFSHGSNSLNSASGFLKEGWTIFYKVITVVHGREEDDTPAGVEQDHAQGHTGGYKEEVLNHYFHHLDFHHLYQDFHYLYQYFHQLFHNFHYLNHYYHSNHHDYHGYHNYYCLNYCYDFQDCHSYHYFHNS